MQRQRVPIVATPFICLSVVIGALLAGYYCDWLL